MRSALRRLRARSLDELRVRGAQALCAALEERRLVADSAELGAALLERRMRPGPDAVLDRLRRGDGPLLSPAFDREEEVLGALRARWPDAERAVVARAERIRSGIFDLLGYEGLRFGTPIDWQLDPVSGRRAPLVHGRRVRFLDPEAVGDHKVVWELNRHQHLLVLGKAYWYTGDEAYARTFAAHVRAWMDANPPKRGINWSSSLEVAFRSISWLWALHFFRRSAALTLPLLRRMLGFLHLHGRHLERNLSTYFSPNTHLTGEALGLFYLGSLFPEFRRAAAWRETGERILLEQLERHVLPDGVYYERSSHYQRYTADFYLHLLALGEAGGRAVRARVERPLLALLDHLAHLQRPDGLTPVLGDDDGGCLLPLEGRATNDFRPTLALAAGLFGRSDYARAGGDAAENLLWLLGPAGLARWEALRREPPGGGSRAFPEGGYFVMRDGWSPESNYLVVDGGPHGSGSCGHAHADALAFELAARGRPMLVDPGTYTYTASPALRDWFRGTAAHNALVVEGEPSSTPAGPFQWSTVARPRPAAWKSHPRFDLFDGAHDGYLRLKERAAHRRSILFLKGDYWVVRDRVRAALPVGVELHFHAAPGIRMESPLPGRVLLRDDDDDRGLLLAPLGAAGRIRLGHGWVSPAYGRRIRAEVCGYGAARQPDPEIVTFLVPVSTAGELPVVTEVEAAGGRGFRVESAGRIDLLLVAAEPRQPRAPRRVEAAGFATDAEWLWVRWRREERDPSEIVLVGGRSATFRGVLHLSCPAGTDHVVASREPEGWRTQGGGAVLLVDPITLPNWSCQPCAESAE